MITRKLNLLLFFGQIMRKLKVNYDAFLYLEEALSQPKLRGVDGGMLI